MIQQQKFVLYHDTAANDADRRPDLIGEYRLETDSHPSIIALWTGFDAQGNLYARGNVKPKSVSEALRAAVHQRDDVLAPEDIDLKVGEALLFEDPRANEENERPKFYGYAREAAQFVRFAGWERGTGITGTAESYRRDAAVRIAATESAAETGQST